MGSRANKKVNTTNYVPYSMRVPDGWSDYSIFGKPLDNLPIVACKVPLKEERMITLDKKDHFSPHILMKKVKKLGCIIDLTNTSTHYDSTTFTNEGIIYRKIYCEGQEIPNSDVTQQFFQAMDSFLEAEGSRGKFVMVHCTHGLNRTGYLLTKYLVLRFGLKPLDAIKVFERARGHSMTRKNYVQDLESLTSGMGKMLLPKKDWWLETYLTWSTQETRSGNPPSASTNFNRPNREDGAGSPQSSEAASTETARSQGRGNACHTHHNKTPPPVVPSHRTPVRYGPASPTAKDSYSTSSNLDVTQHNFQSVLKGLDEELSKASFISLDTEFTGLNDHESLDGNLQPLDSPAERYQKIRESTSEFMIIQVGLTLFYHNKKDKKWSYKSYNFYVFPNFGQFKSIGGFPYNTLPTSPISFLSNKDFDGNKLFKSGICYLNLSDEEKVKKVIEENPKVSDSTNPTTGRRIIAIPIPEEQRSWMKDTMAKVEDFLKTDGDEQNELILENTSIIQETLVSSHGKKKFPLAFFKSKRKENGDRIMLISKTAPENPKKKDAMLRELDKAVGFRKVFEKISDSGKLVVVHNSFLDIAHIIRQFYVDLPADYEDFKALAQSVFPRFLDTKVMASSQPLRERLPNSALGQLLQALLKDPFKLGDISPIPDVPHYTLSQTKSNEAGYDSFITGLCFISMSNYLETLNGNSDGLEIIESGRFNAFTQKIFMMMSPDIPYLCLDGPDLDPPLDEIFYMTFPKTWELLDIQNLFSVYGPVEVNWNGDSAAFVTVLHKENKNLILDNIHPPIGCVLRTYQSFKESTNPLGSSVGDDVPNKSIVHLKSSDTPASSAENGRRQKPNEKRSAEPTPSTDATPATKKARSSQNGNDDATDAAPVNLLEDSEDEE